MNNARRAALALASMIATMLIGCTIPSDYRPSPADPTQFITEGKDMGWACTIDEGKESGFTLTDRPCGGR